jgi:two-component system phosphate regulon sensor histidine kinase PhoR
MSYGWAVAFLLLLLLAWLGLSWRQARAELRQERRNVLEFQRKLAAVVGELSDVKTRRKRLLAASTQALMIVEEDYRVSSANKVAKQLFGSFDKADMTFIAWTRQHQLQKLVDQVLLGEKPPPLYFTLGDKTLEAHARSIKAKRDVIAVALAIHDVTELQRLSRARRDFVANISHELRTPLTSIRLLLETLLNPNVLDDPQERLKIIGRISVQMETLSQLAQEMLDLSLIESGQMPLKLASYPLKSIVQQQVEQLLPQAESKNITLKVAVDEQIMVLVDEKMIGRVIANLVHNAIKFTDQGAVTISAECSTREGARLPTPAQVEWITVAVSDTGTGLPPDQLSRIFERFYKIDRARKQLGTGLGLAIAKHIVEGHGGCIWAENNQPPGVTFFFSLPVED